MLFGFPSKMNKKNFKLDQNAALVIIDVQKGFDEPKWEEKKNLLQKKILQNC